MSQANKMMVKKQVELYTGIPYVSQKNEHLKIDNNFNFSKIIIVHNPGTHDVGSPQLNNVFEYIRLWINGKEAIDLVGDIDDDTEPYMIQLLKQLNKLSNRIADGDGFFTLRMPDLIKRGHNAYLDFRFNTPANISDGAGTTYVGATIDILIEAEDRIPAQNWLPLRNGGKEPFGATTGQALRFFVNPTDSGYTARTLIGLIEDDGTPSNSAIARIKLKKGSDTIKEGSIPKLQELSKIKYQVALDTGFFLIEINQPVQANELTIVATIEGAPTDIDLHWLLNSTKRV